MRLFPISIGIFVFFFSIFGYFYSWTLVHTIRDTTSDFVSSAFPMIAIQNKQDFLPQVGVAFTDSLTTVFHMGFIATMIVGSVAMCYGVLSKTRSSSLLSDPAEKRSHHQREQEMIKLLKEYTETLNKQKELNKQTQPEQQVHIIKQMQPDQQVQLIKQTKPDQQVELIKQMQREATIGITEDRKREILSTNRALGILKMRLAKGEITEREFARLEPFVR